MKLNQLYRRGAALLAVALGLSVTAGCVSDQQVIAQAADVHGQLEPTVVEDPQLDAYVQAVGDRIIEGAKRMRAEGNLPEAEDWMFEDIEFHLVASPTLNAFTTGGKHVYLYTELFEKSDTEAAFAAVVGHEFGHIVGRHVQSSMNRQYGILGGAGLAAAAAALLAEDGQRQQTAGMVGGLAVAGGQLVGLKYGRDGEREADELGFEFYVRAGYPPDEFDEFFRTMIEETGQAQAGGFQGYLSSHPQLQDRVDNAEEMAREVSPRLVEQYREPPIASPREFERLQQLANQYTVAAAREAQRNPNSAFAEAQAILAAFPSCVDTETEAVVDQTGENAPVRPYDRWPPGDRRRSR